MFLHSAEQDSFRLVTSQASTKDKKGTIRTTILPQGYSKDVDILSQLSRSRSSILLKGKGQI